MTSLIQSLDFTKPQHLLVRNDDPPELHYILSLLTLPLIYDIFPLPSDVLDIYWSHSVFTFLCCSNIVSKTCKCNQRNKILLFLFNIMGSDYSYIVILSHEWGRSYSSSCHR
jgi:hypothetical protein